MIGWVILAILVLLVLAVAFLRLGAAAGYDETGGWVKVRVGPAWLTVYPIAEEKKKKRAEKAKKKAEKRAEKKAAKKKKKAAPPEVQVPLRKKLEKAFAPGGDLDLALELLPEVKELVRNLRRTIRIDVLSLHLVWGEPDPADAAIHYGQAWGVLEALLAFAEANFTVKKRELSLALDYQIESPKLTMEAAFSITIGQLLAILWPTVKEVVKALWKWKKTKPSQKKMKKHAAAAAAQGKEETHGKESSCQ